MLVFIVHICVIYIYDNTDALCMNSLHILIFTRFLKIHAANYTPFTRLPRGLSMRVTL